MDSFPQSFYAELAKAGIEYSDTRAPALDGKVHRFKAKGDKEANSWYILFDNGNGFIAGKVGCWKRGFTNQYTSLDRTGLSKEDSQKLNARWREAEAARKLDEKETQDNARNKVKEIVSAASTTLSHPYLASKGFETVPTGSFPVYQSTDLLTEGWLILPLRDVAGIVHSAQFIADDGTKRFQYGGRVKGCYYDLSERASGPIVICEGYATGLSIFSATGFTVKCAMNAGNLQEVAKTLKGVDGYKGRQFILAADNDQFTDGNPGVTKAELVQKDIPSIVLSVPKFSDDSLSEKPTDFNDLHRLAGLPEVSRQLYLAGERSGEWFYSVRDASVTMTETIPEPTQIIQGLLCEQSKLVIGGSSKTYKTWLSIDVALSIATGTRFWRNGTEDSGRLCQQRNVLYVNLELKESTFKRRVQSVANVKGLAIPAGCFFHLSLRGRISGLSVQDIVNRFISLAKANNCTVIIVDPLYKLNVEGEENNTRDQTLFLNQLDRITTEAKAALIFNDHFSKGNQAEKDPLDAIRGSSAKGGDVDAAIILRKHEDDDSFSVDVVQRELAPVEPFVLTWQFPLFSINSGLNPDDMKKPKGNAGRTSNVDTDKLVGYLGTGLYTTEWQKMASQEMGMPRATFYRSIKRLEAENVIFQSPITSRWTRQEPQSDRNSVPNQED